jgi:hypothetical protein
MEYFFNVSLEINKRITKGFQEMILKGLQVTIKFEYFDRPTVLWYLHRYLRKVDCSSFVLCLLPALALPRVFLRQPLNVLTRQTRQAVCVINQSIFKYDVYGYLPLKALLSYDCSSRGFLLQPLAVLTRQVVCAINQSIV